MKGKTLGLMALAAVSVGVFACEVHVGTDPQTPKNANNNAKTTAAPTPAPTPVPTPQPNQSRLARLQAAFKTRPSPGGSATAAPTTPGTTPTAPTAPTASGSAAPIPTTPPAVPDNPFMPGTNSFGTGTPADGTFKGSVYFLTAAPQKVPALDSLTPNTVLFAKELNIASKEFTEGFPGAGPTRLDNFAIRYEAPLSVTKEATYSFRLVADDGAILSIDDTVIVNNDGMHAAAEKVGAAHLIPGMHYMRIDYVQGASKTVALQAFVKPDGGQEKVLTPQL